MKRESQAQRILNLLERYWHPDADKWAWCPLPVIMNLGIASHTRRIHELRRAGHNIEIRKEYVDGQLHTAYRLIR